MDTSKKKPAGLAQPGSEVRITAQGGKTASPYIRPGVLGGGSLRAHNWYSPKAMRLIGVEVLVVHARPFPAGKANQSHQDENWPADVQEHIKLCWAEWHGSALLPGLGRGGGVGGRAQDRPVNVGAQLFAAHRAACGPLNGGAVLGGDAASGLPHAGKAAGHTDGSGKSGGTAKCLNGSFKCVHHGRFVCITVVIMHRTPM